MHKERQIRVRSVRRDPPDLPKFARALIELARAQAEADAEVAHQRALSRQRRRAKQGGEPEVS